MTPEERQQLKEEIKAELIPIIRDEARRIAQKEVETGLIAAPEMVLNLASDHKALLDANRDFYKKHREFKGHEPTVQTVLAEVDGEHPLLSLSEKLDKAVPRIRERIKTMNGLDMEKVNPNPDRRLDFKDIKSPSLPGGNGAI